VTNIGATKVHAGMTVFDPESAANDLTCDSYTSAFSSDGGFSNIYPRPDYQKDGVASYLANHDPGFEAVTGARISVQSASTTVLVEGKIPYPNLRA
jgi:hypothetical protein